LLNQLDVNKEMEKLQKNRGLGGPKHQRLIYDLITGTRQTLADVVFCLAAQAGLQQSAVLALIKHCSEIKYALNNCRRNWQLISHFLEWTLKMVLLLMESALHCSWH
jgi:hypothetical protein